MKYPIPKLSNSGNCDRLVFIDLSVDDSASLIAGVTPAANVILLDPSKDGNERVSPRQVAWTQT